MFVENLKFSVLEGKQCYSKWEKVLIENYVNRESNILELKIYLYRCYYEHEAHISFNTTVYLSDLNREINRLVPRMPHLCLNLAL